MTWTTADVERVKQPLARLGEYITEADRLLTLCMAGFGTLSQMAPLAEALEDLEGLSGDSESREGRDMEDIHQRAAFAQAEIDRGFPLLHAHTLVGAWGALESTILDFMVAWLLVNPAVLQRPDFKKVKIPLADFEALDREERMRYVVDTVERDAGTQFKAGVTRFEGLLALIGLSGPVDDDTRKHLHEAFQLRNVIVHRAAIADRRFVEACPQLGYKVGEKVVISHEAWLKYRNAIYRYATAVIRRVTEYRKAQREAVSAEGTGQAEGALP